MAYSIADKQDTAIVLDTLSKLPSTKGTMLQRDQGSVYTSQAYQEAVKKKALPCAFPVRVRPLIMPLSNRSIPH